VGLLGRRGHRGAVGLAAIALPHSAAALGALRGRDWGRWLGVLIGLAWVARLAMAPELLPLVLPLALAIGIVPAVLLLLTWSRR